MALAEARGESTGVAGPEIRKGPGALELVVYSILSVVALGIISSLLSNIRQSEPQTPSQQLATGELATAIRTIRKELQATSLASVRVYGEKGEETPGFSCISAYDDKGEFRLSIHGTPHWQKFVTYTLDKQGVVTRWTRELDPDMPTPTSPGDRSAPGAGRTLLEKALPPYTTVGSFQEATRFGGLEVGFVRRPNGKEIISRVNPSESPGSQQNTGLIEVVLRTLDPDGPEFTEVKFRVAPRY